MKEILDHYEISEEDIKYHLVDDLATEAEFNRIYLEITTELQEAQIVQPP